MQVNDVIELEIESMSYGSAAVGRYAPGNEQRATGTGSGERGSDARVVVFVEGAMPEERVAVRLRKKHKNYWEATLVEILRPSPDRITPACPVFDECGGCQWQFMTYDAQLRAKEDILVHQLHRTARLELRDIRSKLTIHPAKSPWGYRARLQAHGDALGLGFFKPGTHEIVHTDRCHVAHPDIQNAWQELKNTSRLKALAEKTGQFKVEWTKTEDGQLKEAINRKHGAYGFTQVNPEQNEVLRDVVTKLALSAPSTQNLFDLYGGDGNLSRQLADQFDRVICVDSFNKGVDPADRPNQTRTSSGHRFLLINSRIEDFLRNQYWRDWAIDRIDCVIADPPRNGLRETAGPIANLQASRVILVSCDPSTLARDLTAFLSSYSVDQIHLIDMFPQTFHLESVVSLHRRR